MDLSQLVTTEEQAKTKIDLSSIVKKTSEQFITDREKYVQNLVYGLFQRQNGLMLEIQKLENELKKKNEALKTTQEKVSKIMEGDWSVIKKIEEEAKIQQKNDSN